MGNLYLNRSKELINSNTKHLITRNIKNTTQSKQNHNHNNHNNDNINHPTLSHQERDLLIQMMKYNNNQIFVSIVNDHIVQSLYLKNFIEATKEEDIFTIRENVVLLYKLEGESVFDQIVRK